MLGVRGSAKRLPARLDTDESIELVANANRDNLAGVLAITTKRVVFYARKPLWSGEEWHEVQRDSIDSISISSTGFTASLTVQAAGGSLAVDTMSQKAAAAMREHLAAG